MLHQVKMFIISLMMSTSQPHPIATVDINELACMTHALQYEAGNESLKGKIAVANVIVNRTEDESFPSTICGVVKQKGQFSYWKNLKRLDKTDEKVVDQLNECLEAALIVMNKETTDNTNGALYFVNMSTATNKSWLSRLRLTKKIENHAFFANKVKRA